MANSVSGGDRVFSGQRSTQGQSRVKLIELTLKISRGAGLGVSVSASMVAAGASYGLIAMRRLRRPDRGESADRESMPLVLRTDSTISVGAKSTTLPPRPRTARAGSTIERKPMEPRNETFSRSISSFLLLSRDDVHFEIHNRGSGNVEAPIQFDLGDAAGHFFRRNLHFFLPFSRREIGTG